MVGDKKKMIEEFNKLIDPNNLLSINGVKKIATYETILRFYQNSMNVFAIKSHTHYPQDIVLDELHNFVSKEQLDFINQSMKSKTATNEEILELFK